MLKKEYNNSDKVLATFNVFSYKEMKDKIKEIKNMICACFFLELFYI